MREFVKIDEVQEDFSRRRCPTLSGPRDGTYKEIHDMSPYKENKNISIDLS